MYTKSIPIPPKSSIVSFYKQCPYSKPNSGYLFPAFCYFSLAYVEGHFNAMIASPKSTILFIANRLHCYKYQYFNITDIYKHFSEYITEEVSHPVPKITLLQITKAKPMPAMCVLAPVGPHPCII